MRAGAWLAASGLPERWQGRPQFVMLQDGFGLGRDFLATWQAWLDDEQRCDCLHVIAIEAHPPAATALAAALPSGASTPLMQALVAAWPVLTPGLHRMSFEGGRLQLLLALGATEAWLRELVACVDAFWLPAFWPTSCDQPPSDSASRRFKRLARLAAADATLVAAGLSAAERHGLVSAGFVRDGIRAAPDRTDDLTLARYAPPFVPRRAAARGTTLAAERSAVIVGAGLAGCAAAWALAEQGWQSRVLDRQEAPAQEGSGNPAGLFHGIVNAWDGAHARYNRSAALEAQKAVRIAIHEHGAAGAVRGLLRLETATADVSVMAAQLKHLRLPVGYVEAVSAARASELCGMSIRQPAWFYPGGGWVQPGGLARSYLQRAAGRVIFRGGVSVHRLERRGAQWALLDEHGRLIEQAGTVVLANAADSVRLLARPDWPLEAVRGQISMRSLGREPRTPVAASARHVEWEMPTLPLTGAGYLIPAHDGLAVFGATSQAGDADGSVRHDDHAANLAQLSRLTGLDVRIDVNALLGRTGWRHLSSDRLPIIGGVPRSEHPSQPGWAARHAEQTSRLDQPRLVPREPGLYVCSAFGSRGITWSALSGQVLAAWVTGSPVPVESALADAVDPARFISRIARRRVAVV